MDENQLFKDLLQPGATWSHTMKRGTSLRITDIHGNANVGAIFYNHENPAERYNMPDTLKAQHIARLTRGNVLYSDMGDPLSGCSNAAGVRTKYGDARYQEHHNDCHQNAYDGFVIELAKYGLSARDMAAPINFFSKVVVTETGAMHFLSGNSKPGMFVELRAEMNVLVILNTCQHPLDPNPKYEPRPVHLSILKTAPAAFDDACRQSRPQNDRGFILTERYFL
jgi:urea carboxylase-associated protein 2